VGRIRRLRFGHWIKAARMPWVAAQQAFDSHHASASGAVPLDRLRCVLRARGRKAARRRQQRGNRTLVDADDRDQRVHTRSRAGRFGLGVRARVSAFIRCSCSSSNRNSAAPLRHWITYHRCGAPRSIRSRIALHRRRSRLRSTAFPTVLGTTTPIFVFAAAGPRGVKPKTVSAFAPAAVPRRTTRVNSRRPRRLS